MKGHGGCSCQEPQAIAPAAPSNVEGRPPTLRSSAAFMDLHGLHVELSYLGLKGSVTRSVSAALLGSLNISNSKA
jgi:hypothetical protein